MIRSAKLSLSAATVSKLSRVAAIVREYRTAINFYLKSLWNKQGKLDALTLKRYKGGSLGYRQRAVCLKMALELFFSTKKAAYVADHRWSCPDLKGSVRVSELCAKIEPFNKNGFDYCLKLASPIKRHPIIIPLKSTRVLNKWLAISGAKLKNGCVLNEKYVSVYINIPDQPDKTTGIDLGLDTGYNKLATTSDGKTYGTDFKIACEKVRRSKIGGKGRRRTVAMRTQYINKAVKSLPWTELKTLVVEDLTNLQDDTQRKDKSSKKSRKTMAPWAYRQVLNRIEQLAPENRVRLVYVDPRNTSRRCPVCGWVAKENRVREKFCCVRCNYSADADFVGATNILARMTGNWQEDIVPASSKQGSSREAV